VAGVSLNPVVHTESLTGGVLRTRDAEVRVYREAFADLSRRALDPAASRSLILQLSSENAAV
jgi:Domain of unknown function (DUF5753)